MTYHYPSREDKVLAGLSFEWKTFDQIVQPYSALDAKQLTGTLVRLRNEGRVASRIVHVPQHRTQWRLSWKDL